MPVTAKLWEPIVRSCFGSHTLSCCLPSPVPGRSPNTHHLGSTTEGTASELRAPWGRRFLGPRKKSTSSHGSSWMTKGLPFLLFLLHRLGVSSLFSGHYHSKEQTPSQPFQERFHGCIQYWERTYAEAHFNWRRCITFLPLVKWRSYLWLMFPSLCQ